MSCERAPPDIRISTHLRVTLPAEAGAFAEALRIVSGSGCSLQGHLAYRLGETTLGLFLCDRPEDGALALQGAGFPVETETVVTLRGADRPELLRHVIHTIEAEDMQVGYSYSTVCGGELLLVLRTSDNPKAEDVLRSLFLLHDPAGRPARMEQIAALYEPKRSS